MKSYSDFGINIPHGKVSGTIKIFCPQCHDVRTNKRDRSLSVNLDKGVWNCHYCSWAGTIHVSEFDNSPEGKRKWLESQSWYNASKIKKQKPTYEQPAERNGELTKKALKWFSERGISEATLNEVKVTEGLEWMPQKNKHFNTVQFNYYWNGQLINTKFRTGDKCFKLHAGARLIPYMIDNIKGSPTAIITEGEIDALSFYECGLKNVVSVPNGANANLDYLDDFIEDYFDDKETIFIAVDTDTKGIVLRDELVRRFGAERCRVIDYGMGCKDANEHLIKYGRNSLIEIVKQAPEIKIEGIFTVRDFEDSLDAIFDKGLQRGVTIGHENFDELCSFETKRLCIVTGIPGSGKSEFIDEIAERLNMRHNWRFAYFSPENAPLAYHASKLIEKFTGKKFRKENLTYGHYKQVKQHLETNFFFINPKDDFKLKTILDRAKFLVRRKGIKALVIDPFNKLEDENDNISETRYISKLLDRLTNFAQQNDVLIILMAHPAKQTKNKDGVIDAPSLYDISGSAHFYNKADFGLVVHRNRIMGVVDVHVQKVKFKHLGKVGTATFLYNINNGRYLPYENKNEADIKWDNTNHLIEDIKQQELDAFQTATIEWNYEYEDYPF